MRSPRLIFCSRQQALSKQQLICSIYASVLYYKTLQFAKRTVLILRLPIQTFS